MDRVICRTLDSNRVLFSNMSDWPFPWVEGAECPASFDPATGILQIQAADPQPLGPVPVWTPPGSAAPARRK